MPVMTCTPCNSCVLISPTDPPRCPQCLGDMVPTTVEAVVARLTGSAAGDVELGLHGERYRSLRLRHQAQVAVAVIAASRARMRSLLDENAALRERLRGSVAETRATMERP